MTLKISSAEKYACARCGRKFRLHRGALTGFDANQPQFYCLRCLKQMRKEEREKCEPLSDAKVAAIRKEFEKGLKVLTSEAPRKGTRSQT